MFKGIDLYSDTVTKPTQKMRHSMSEALVGDEQRGEDPTTLKLEERVAGLLGHSAAMFFPSATMANQVALLELGCRGEELITAENSHILMAEAGGPAFHSGLMVRPINTQNGIFSGHQIRECFSDQSDPHRPSSCIVCVENTTNLGGGVAWPLDALDDVLGVAKLLGIRTHMDGARLFNAATALSCEPKRLASGFDTVTICLSKGLGCPAGAVLAFDRSRWKSIRKLKQRMGGALRQSGILAQAGLYALDNHIDLLQIDHDNAARFAIGLKDLKCIELEKDKPSTNMVYFRVNAMEPDLFINSCIHKGLRFSRMGKNRFRAVTHFDVSSEEIEQALVILREICH